MWSHKTKFAFMMSVNSLLCLHLQAGLCFWLMKSQQFAPWSPHFSSLPLVLPFQEKVGVLDNQFHVGCSYLSLASSSPCYLQKRHLQEHTQLALCLRERQSKTAGDVPLPIKINGTKAPCVLHEFHLPGSLLSVFSHQAPSRLSCPLQVFDTGQKSSLKRRRPCKSDQEAHAQPTHTSLYTHADTCVFTYTINTSTLIHVHAHFAQACTFSVSICLKWNVGDLMRVSWWGELHCEGSRKKL